ncbi:MAG TPA: EAL domain-containing protein, partial [Steroidobacteraceae bacterium]
ITNVMTSADDASIVQAIISLAHGLRLKVVAEGVETADQMQFLQQLGCDQYQGFYFSQPVDAAAFEQLLRGGSAPEIEGGLHRAERTHSRLAMLPPAAGAK